MEKIIEELNKLIKKALKRDESPVAALIVYNGKIISKGYNRRNKSNMTTDHAEIIAINKANKRIHSWRLNKCTLYVTLEPCEMFMGAIKESRISRVVYGCSKSLNYFPGNNLLVDGNIETNKCLELLQKFFQNKR